MKVHPKGLAWPPHQLGSRGKTKCSVSFLQNPLSMRRPASPPCLPKSEGQGTGTGTLMARTRPVLGNMNVLVSLSLSCYVWASRGQIFSTLCQTGQKELQLYLGWLLWEEGKSMEDRLHTGSSLPIFQSVIKPRTEKGWHNFLGHCPTLKLKARGQGAGQTEAHACGRLSPCHNLVLEGNNLCGFNNLKNYNLEIYFCGKGITSSSHLSPSETTYF